MMQGNSFSFLLLAVFLTLASCKNRKSLEADSRSLENNKVAVASGAETKHDRIAFRDSLLAMDGRWKAFFDGMEAELKRSGMVVVNDPSRAKSMIRYLDSLELYGAVFPKEHFAENHYKKPNIYDRYLLGSDSALDSMVAVLDTGSTEKANAMLEEIENSSFLHEAKWTYPNPFVEIDTNLISSPLLIEKIIPYLKTPETEFAAARLVMMLKDREEILGGHLFSNDCRQQAFVLRDLLQFTRSAEALDFLEQNMGKLDSLGIRGFHLEDPLAAYMENARDPGLKAKAVLLGGEYLLSYRIRDNASDLSDTRLVNALLEFEGKEVIPFLMGLKKKNVKDPRIELKLWAMSAGMSDEELIDYLTSREVNLTPNGSGWYDFMDYRLFMLDHDKDRSLREQKEKFYRFLFKDIMEASYIGAMNWWSGNLHGVMYYFKDLEEEEFAKRIRPVLEYDMSLNTYYDSAKIEERLAQMSELLQRSQESVDDVLDFFLETGFIGRDEYETARKKVTVEGLEDEFGRNFYAALNAIEPRRLHLIGGKYEYFPHRVRNSGIIPLSEYRAYESFGVKSDEGEAAEQAECMAWLAGEKIYLMAPLYYRSDEYCACDRMMHFFNEILTDQGHSDRLTKYYGGICEVCSFFYADPPAAEEIMAHYRSALKRR